MKEPSSLKYIIEGIPKIFRMFLEFYKSPLRNFFKGFTVIFSLAMGVVGLLNLLFNPDAYIKAYGLMLMTVAIIVVNWFLDSRD